MNLYARQLHALNDAIIHGQVADMLPLVKHARSNVLPAQERIAVYADGYVERLVEATAVDYPALSQYMGEVDCRKLIRAFVQDMPSVTWDLNLYPIGLAEYVAAHSSDGRAQALAKLESAIVTVFWLPESTPLLPDALSALTEEALGRQRFRLRTASRLLALDYAADDYLTAFRENAALASMAAMPEYLCVVRHQNEVRRLALDAIEYALLASLHQGMRFGEALDAAGQPDLLAGNLSAYVSRWLAGGIFQALC